MSSTTKTWDDRPIRIPEMRIRRTHECAGQGGAIAPDLCNRSSCDPEELPRPMRCKHPESLCGYRTIWYRADKADICIAQLLDILLFTQVRTGPPDFDKPGAEPGEEHKVKRQPGILRDFPYPPLALCHHDGFLHRLYRWSPTGHGASPARGFECLKRFWIIVPLYQGANGYLRKP